MKLFKYFAALLLIFSMNVCLISCGDDDEPTPAVDPKDFPQHEFFYVDGIGYKSISGADVEVTRLSDWSKPDDKTIPDYYTGDVFIPSKVTYQGYTYNVVSIGKRAFFECAMLNSVTMPATITAIENYAFSRSGLKSVRIGGKVKEIGEDAFAECEKLTSVTITDDVMRIGSRAFFASGVEKLSIGGNVREIGNAAFYDCNKLTRIRFPESVVEFGDYAFQSCGELYSITLGENTVKIGIKAFANCPKLKYVMCRAESVPMTAYSAFIDDPMDELRVPVSAINYYKTLPPWKFFAKFAPIDE